MMSGTPAAHRRREVLGRPLSFAGVHAVQRSRLRVVAKPQPVVKAHGVAAQRQRWLHRAAVGTRTAVGVGLIVRVGAWRHVHAHGTVGVVGMQDLGRFTGSAAWWVPTR